MRPARDENRYVIRRSNIDEIKSGNKGMGHGSKKRKDITLSNNGDKNGNENKTLSTKTTCSAETLYLMREAFQKSELSVSINDPYRGGYITTHYGQKYAAAGKMAVQIEINQNLYLKPGDIHPLSEKLKDVKHRVKKTFEEIGRTIL